MNDLTRAIRALAADKEKLKAAPEQDVTSVLRKLEELAASIDVRTKSSDYDVGGAKKIEPLRERFQSLTAVHVFKAGDIVKWKEGLKNRRRPKINEPAIVIEYRPVADVFTDEKDAGTPYFREPLNLVLGLIDDGELYIYHFDGRRFEPWRADDA